MKMSVYETEKHHLEEREVLLYFFSVKKFTIESHRLLVQAYGEPTLSETRCRDWFQRFKSSDFYMKDKEHAGRPKLVAEA